MEFKDTANKDLIEIDVYIDEIKPFKTCRGKKKNYLAIGCLFVPLDKKNELIKEIMDCRCITGRCWEYKHELCNKRHLCKPEYHYSNETEIHFYELKKESYSHKKISSGWLDFLIKNNESKRRLVYFNILYIDLDKLDSDCFGDLHQLSDKIYSRFLRTTINYAIKVFFDKYKKVILNNVYQDAGNCESYSFFRIKNLSILEEGSKNLEIRNKEMIFINSDPRKYINLEDIHNSNLVQFMDLILGSLNQCLLDPSNNKLKKETAMIVFQLAKKFISKPYSTYQHLSFFPKSMVKSKTLFGSGSEEYKSSFFYPEKLEMAEYNPHQKELSKYFS